MAKKQAKSAQKSNESAASGSTSFSSKPALICFLFGLLLYIPTVTYDYALDDKIAVTGNQVTKRGFAGIADLFKYDSMDGFWAEQYGVDVEDLNKDALVAGGRYRPLTMVTHAIEWQFFGENPGISHFINALLYGLTGYVLWHIMALVFPAGARGSEYLAPAFVITILYLSHPLHTEAVANIKGRDEVLSMLLGLYAWWYALRYTASEKKNELYASAAFFLGGVLAKESAIAFAGVIPLSLYFTKGLSLPDALKQTVPVFAASAFYVVIRYQVLGELPDSEPTELMNNPFLNADSGQKWGTILLTFAVYYKLLLVPAPLTHDYYPYHLPFTDESTQYAHLSHPAAIIGLIGTLGLIFLAAKGFKSRSKAAFGSLFFLGTFLLVSNVIFPLGVFMNERFMYVSSLGFLIIVFAFLEDNGKMNRKAVSQLALGVAGVFAVLTFMRNPAWTNDETLSLTDVEISTGSAKAHMGAGQALLAKISDTNDQTEKQELIQSCFDHLKTSLEIYPGYFAPLDLLGQLYFESGNYLESAKYYGYCADRKPGTVRFTDNIIFIGNKLVQEKRFAYANTVYLQALSYRPNDVSLLSTLAENYGKNLNDIPNSKKYLDKAYSLDPGSPDVLQKLGVVYGMQGNLPKAEEFFRKAAAASPADAVILRNLAITLQQQGKAQEAAQFFQQAEQLQGQIQP